MMFMNVTDLAGSLVTSCRPQGRTQTRPDDRTRNAGVAVRTADGVSLVAENYINAETKVFEQKMSQHKHTRLTAFFRDYPANRHQKGKTNLYFTEARDSEWQWHQLGHMQV